MQQDGFAQYIGDFVYGANDGIITTFAVVAGVAGAELSAAVVIILGISNLFADGLSMAASNYLATRSEEDYLEGSGRERELGKHPVTAAAITFLGFVLIGFVPLTAYVLRVTPMFPWAVFLVAAALFSVGAGRTMVTGKFWFRSGVEMLLVGGAAGTAAFVLGRVLRGIVAV